MNSTFPIIDLHCDLLSYLVRHEHASIHSKDHIGASLPHLKAGQVKTQVCAIFTVSKEGSSNFASDQAEAFGELLAGKDFVSGRSEQEIADTLDSDRPGIYAAMENASGLLEEDEKIELLPLRLDQMIKKTGGLLYISFTHHLANRFGGGNFSDNLPLTADGEALLALLDGKGICADLSHASDALAEGILTHIEKQRYKIPVIASHSNFRPICDHPRNLPDEFAQEIIRRKGLIGINFVRDFVGPDDPHMLFEHILYGIEELHAQDCLAFGADFFDESMITDEVRQPIFHPQHKNASKFPSLLQQLKGKSLSQEVLEKISHRNVLNFIKKLR